ncbi:MAG: GDSL-type esterase/lipase family protein [Candidatus Hydrogenedentes bacterium]|nr:GDSL-type esterase/lipase family protein [Candidatus Hydrogenedentota bacterium]
MTNRCFLFVLMMLLTLVAQGAEEKTAYRLRDAVESTVRDGLPNFFAKLEAGETVRIGYLGGSITAQPGWRPKTLAWFQEQYPDAEVSQINAAIGGTGSGLGVFRLEQDVLQHKPDLLFVEFAVNDGGTPPESIYRSMEGIVRKTFQANPSTDICFVYTLTQGMLKDLQGGKYPRAASAMEVIADHYGIPSIHMGLEVACMEEAGTVVFKGPKPKTEAEREALAGKVLFSGDGVHPYPEGGHVLYLDAVARSMKSIKKAGEPGPHELPAPYVADNWENAIMIPLDRAMLSAGWEELKPEENDIAKRFQNRMPRMWQASTPGETVSFSFKGTYAAIYDILGPDCGQMIVRVDDEAPVIKPRFDAYCTYHRLATLKLAADLPDDVHRVTVEIHPEQPDKVAILSKNGNTMDNPARFDGTRWYAGAIMLLGELVEGE